MRLAPEQVQRNRNAFLLVYELRLSHQLFYLFLLKLVSLNLIDSACETILGPTFIFFLVLLLILRCKSLFDNQILADDVIKVRSVPIFAGFD